MSVVVDNLPRRVMSGEVAAIARMISRAEKGVPGSQEQLAELYRAGGHARVIGITGAPGSGKSTLVSVLTQALRSLGSTVGIVAVDPSSPYSGGSILGDRIRMGALSADEGVFIRSMATRGALGGLSRATVDAVTVLDAAGKDYVLVETVGVGQDEVEIASASHVTVVVSVPGLGDDIQAIKAGVIEIADIHVVNKADREGAERTAAELRTMLALASAASREGWQPPVLLAVGTTGEGVPEIVRALEAHHAWLVDSGRLAERERHMAGRRIQAIASQLLLDHLRDPSSGAGFAEAVEAVRHRRTDPFSAAERLILSLG